MILKEDEVIEQIMSYALPEGIPPGYVTIKMIMNKSHKNRDTVRGRVEKLVENGILEKEMRLVDGKRTAVYRSIKPETSGIIKAEE